MKTVGLLVGVAVVAAMVSGQTCTVLQDVDLTGTDIGTTAQFDPVRCCADCQATADCAAYNWFDGVCYLKSDRGSTIPLVGAVSGVVPPTPLPMTTQPSTCSFLQDVDFEGGDIGSTDQQDPANCCADCQANPQCKLFNWFGGVCYLKSDQGRSWPLPGSVSGFVGASPTRAPTPQPTRAPTVKPTTAPTPQPTRAPTPKPTPSPTDVPTCLRIRKPWESLSPAEQDTFVSAIEVAMDRGLYNKFVSIHREQMSNVEAHGTCVFLFWHRKFLLGFENMLRSLGDQYKCLTLPYWDYVQNYATMQNTPQPRSASCPRCTPCGNWANTAMLSDMGIANIRRSVLGGSNIRTVSDNIEASPHNILHSTLGGPMSNPLVSPMDPMFFMHHNTIDLLHTIYYKCRVEPLNLSDLQQQNDVRSFQGCSTSNGDAIGPLSTLRMRVVNAGRAIEVANDPLIGAFFKDLPTQYYKLTDVRQLGYSFEIKGLLGDLYTKCGGAKAMEISAPVANTTIDNVVQPIVLQENKNVLAFEDAVLAQAASQGLSTDEGYMEVQKMNVLLQENCLPGSVADFTPEFKAMWHITGVSKSFGLLQDIQSGKNPVRILHWQDILAKYYNCDTNTTRSADSH